MMFSSHRLSIFCDSNDGKSASCSISANLVLQDTVERVYVGDAYVDIERGIYLIRGENVVLLGEIVRKMNVNSWIISIEE